MSAWGQEDITEVEEALLVGSRVPDRSAIDSPVPVDVIGGEDLSMSGFTDIGSLLSFSVPSFNVNEQPISDAATLVRPATLRGLPADSTLILVNGKRRHRASVVTFWGGGINDGAQGPDLASLPYIALKRVELLRDGATAQYGSDAVAGILNFVLRDEDHGGSVETRWGRHYEGDGAAWTVAVNTGMPMRGGFANFSMEYSERASTVRSVQRADAQALIDADRDHISPHVRTPHAQVWGNPDVEYEFKFLGNLGLPLSEESELYLFPGFSRRKVEGGFYYRNPVTRSGIYQGIPRETIKVADLRDNPDPATVPVVRLVDIGGTLVPDPDDLARVEADPDFFAFNRIRPGGFTPRFGGVITDLSLGGGLRGSVRGNWRYDLGAVIGQHRTEFFMRNTLNPQLVAHPDFRDDPSRIPTDFRPGSYTETDYVLNLDLARSIDLDWFHSPLNLAGGLEYRVEEFAIGAGEEYAWWVDRRPGGIAEQGFGTRTNGFPAFPPSIDGESDRGSHAAWIDMEADVVRDLLLGTALRYERFEGSIGDSLNGKLSARWQAHPRAALRASVSTGFRAPTMGQASVRNVATAFALFPDGTHRLSDVATLPVENLPEGVFPGARPLEPETSFQWSLGAVLTLDRFNLTLDYYRIRTEDRISLTSEFDWPLEDAAGDPVPNPFNYHRVRWFSNDFDTTTQGLDLVAEHLLEHSLGETLLSLAFNLNFTSVDRAGRFVDAKRVHQLEKSLPETRFVLAAVHGLGPWHLVLPRLRHYGGFVEYSAGTFLVEPDPRLFLDLEVGRDFESGLRLVAGADNLLDTYPSSTSPEASSQLGALWPETSPYGFNGGFYYIKAIYRF